MSKIMLHVIIVSSTKFQASQYSSRQYFFFPPALSRLVTVHFLIWKLVFSKESLQKKIPERTILHKNVKH